MPRLVALIAYVLCVSAWWYRTRRIPACKCGHSTLPAEKAVVAQPSQVSPTHAELYQRSQLPRSRAAYGAPQKNLLAAVACNHLAISSSTSISKQQQQQQPRHLLQQAAAAHQHQRGAHEQANLLSFFVAFSNSSTMRTSISTSSSTSISNQQ